MISWEHLFKKTTLEKARKNKAKITDIKHTCSTINATLKTSKSFEVKLVVEDDELLDMNCSCSSKTSCVHEAKFLQFIEEFPEILEDHKKYYESSESVLNVNTDVMLKHVSSTKLNAFIKKELKTNKKFRYDFIRHFSEKPLIDKKLYEKNLKSIFSNGKEPGFKYYGYYSMNKLSRPLKAFMRKDIKKLIEMKEYKFAAKLLNDIMDTLSDEIYIDDRRFWDVVYYYQDYANVLLDEHLKQEDRTKMKSHLNRFAFFGF